MALTKYKLQGFNYIIIRKKNTSVKQCLHLGPIFRTLVRFRTFLIKVVRKWSGFAAKVRILGRFASPLSYKSYIIIYSSTNFSNAKA